MSFSKRLFNIARGELGSAAEKVKRRADGLLGRDPDAIVDEELEERETPRPPVTEAQPKRGATRAGRSTRSAPPGDEPEHIRRYYANLELPIGATVLEVKAAYRRLMRRYHPDLHQGDGEKAKVATALAQELRTAYEGLLDYLGPRER
ncbi:J domain-containing protein [Myxococcota bacterium]|nr:J domain-containing protein [Myxococcota bacterium]